MAGTAAETKRTITIRFSDERSGIVTVCVFGESPYQWDAGKREWKHCSRELYDSVEKDFLSGMNRADRV